MGDGYSTQSRLPPRVAHEVHAFRRAIHTRPEVRFPHQRERGWAAAAPVVPACLPSGSFRLSLHGSQDGRVGVGVSGVGVLAPAWRCQCAIGGHASVVVIGRARGGEADWRPVWTNQRAAVHLRAVNARARHHLHAFVTAVIERQLKPSHACLRCKPAHCVLGWKVGQFCRERRRSR